MVIFIGIIFLIAIIAAIGNYFANTEKNCSVLDERYTLNRVSLVKNNNVIDSDIINDMSDFSNNMFSTDKLRISFDFIGNDFLINIFNKTYYNIKIYWDDICYVSNERSVNVNYGGYLPDVLPHVASVQKKYTVRNGYNGIFCYTKHDAKTLENILAYNKIGKEIRIDVPFSIEGTKNIYSFFFTLKEQKVIPIEKRIYKSYLNQIRYN